MRTIIVISILLIAQSGFAQDHCAPGGGAGCVPEGPGGPQPTPEAPPLAPGGPAAPGGMFVAPPATGTVVGARESVIVRGLSLHVPAMSFGFPSLEFPSLQRTRQEARMEIASSTAPYMAMPSVPSQPAPMFAGHMLTNRPSAPAPGGPAPSGPGTGQCEPGVGQGPVPGTCPPAGPMAPPSGAKPAAPVCPVTENTPQQRLITELTRQIQENQQQLAKLQAELEQLHQPKAQLRQPEHLSDLSASVRAFRNVLQARTYAVHQSVHLEEPSSTELEGSAANPELQTLPR